MRAAIERHGARSSTEAKLLLIGIPVLLWTMLPIYHLFLFAISPKESALGGQAVARPADAAATSASCSAQQHHYLDHFWLQLWNSLIIAVAVGALTLVVATGAAFAISRLKVRGGRLDDEPRAVHLLHSRPRSSRCRCTRRWASTACSTASGR